MTSEHPQCVISDSLRNSVWNELYDNERVSRYYQEILKKHKVIDWTFKSLTAMLALSIAFLQFIDSLPIFEVISVLSFLCSYVIGWAFGSVKVSVLTQARSGCSTIQSMLEDLWRDVESSATDDKSVRFRLSQILKTKDAMVNNPILKAKFTEDRKLNIKCAKEARQNMINMYEGASA